MPNAQKHDPQTGMSEKADQADLRDKPNLDVFSPGNRSAFSELWDLANGNPRLQAFLARKLPTIYVVRRPGRPKREVIEAVGRQDRDLDRDELCRAISKASGERRQALFARARALHSADERSVRRGKLIRLWRDWYGHGMTINKVVASISNDLDLRRRVQPKSTGCHERDELIDKILVCRFELSPNTIRSAFDR